MKGSIVIPRRQAWSSLLVPASLLCVIPFVGCAVNNANTTSSIANNTSASSQSTSSTTSTTTSTLSLDSTNFTVSQANGEVVVAVNRIISSSNAVTVAYATTDGTALAGTDYTATSGTLTWSGGDSTTRLLKIPVSTSASSTSAKTFTFSLSSPGSGASLGNIQSSVIAIQPSPTAPAAYSQYDLSIWNLNLPVDKNGTTTSSAATIPPAQLVAGYASPYFQADTSGDIVFTAPSNGAVTTTAEHSRSELREIYTGTNTTGNSEWTSTQGGTLQASCRVLASSVNSSQATIGQIHGDSQAFVLLMYRPATHDIAAKIYTTLSSSGAYTVSQIVSGVYYGDVINYTMQYSGSALTITVNGTQSTFTIDSSWAGTPMYFKLGSYSAAPNSGNPSGDQTQVEFSSFTVSH